MHEKLNRDYLERLARQMRRARWRKVAENALILFGLSLMSFAFWYVLLVAAAGDAP